MTRVARVKICPGGGVPWVSNEGLGALGGARARARSIEFRDGAVASADEAMHHVGIVELPTTFPPCRVLAALRSGLRCEVDLESRLRARQCTASEPSVNRHSTEGKRVIRGGEPAIALDS